MPNLTDKGVNIPVWMASIIFGLAVTLIGWIYNQQGKINEQQVEVNSSILDALNVIKSDIRLNSLEKQYLIERLERLEKSDNDQEKRIDKLERHHD